MRARLLGLLLLLPAVAAAQDSGSRPVETYQWDTSEGRIMGFYSAALAFSPVGAPSQVRSGGVNVGLELSLIPQLTKEQRTERGSKTETTNLAPVLPRPRVMIGLPHNMSIEASWVPPVRAFDAKANLFAGALTSRLYEGPRGVLSARLSGSGGYAGGAITCNEDFAHQGYDDSVYFLHICHNKPSDDKFKPLAFAGELLGHHAMRGGSFVPYVGLGIRTERNRFEVGVKNFNGTPDTNHPELAMNVTRGYGMAGATWRAPWLGSSFSGEAFYAPGSTFTVRVLAALCLRDGAR